MSIHRMLEDLKYAEYVRPQESVVISDTSVASSTTLADISGLVARVEQGKRYRFRGRFFVTCGSTGLVKLAVSGTCTATVLIASVQYIDNTTPGQTGARITALDSAVAATAAVTAFEATIEGYIEPGRDGTLVAQFAQSVSNGTDTTIKAGSWWTVHEMAYTTETD